MEDISKEKKEVTLLRIEEFEREKGIGRKFYQAYQKLGKYNLGKLLGENFMNKLQKKEGDSKLKRFGKAGARFFISMANVRTAITAGLVGVGGLAGGGFVAAGAYAAKKIFFGLGSGIVTYDLLKMGREKAKDAWGLGRTLTQEELKNINIEELINRTSYFEQRAEDKGDESYLENENYKNLAQR